MTNKEAKEILEWELNNFEYTDNEFVEATKVAIKALEERPKGEWIIDGHHRRCKKCDEYFCMADSEGNEIPSNFCPNCGANMVADLCSICKHGDNCERSDKGFG